MESKPGVDTFSIILECLRHPETPVPSDDDDAPMPMEIELPATSKTEAVNEKRPTLGRKSTAKPLSRKAVSEKRPSLSRKTTAMPLSRKAGKKEAKPRKKRGRKPVDQSFCETCGADLEHYAKTTASKMRSWCKNGQSRCNKQTRKHRTRKQIAAPLTKPCGIVLERVEDIQNKKVSKSVLVSIKTFEKKGFKICEHCSKKFYDVEDLQNHLLHFCRKPHINKEPKLSDKEKRPTLSRKSTAKPLSRKAEKVNTEEADKSVQELIAELIEELISKVITEAIEIARLREEDLALTDTDDEEDEPTRQVIPELKDKPETEPGIEEPIATQLPPLAPESSKNYNQDQTVQELRKELESYGPFDHDMLDYEFDDQLLN